MSKKIQAYFPNLVEIIVDEGAGNINVAPRIFVTLEFGLTLRVGDNLFFNPEGDRVPFWVVKWENPEVLFDAGITLTQRNITAEGINFYAKIC